MIQYQELQTFIVVTLSICGGITCIGAAISTIRKWLKPQSDINKQVENHENWLKGDKERLDKMENDNKMVMKCLLTIIDHQITGNGINNMKQTKVELQQYLVER